MHKLAELFAQSASFADYARAYAARLHEVTLALDFDALGRAADRIAQAADAGRTLFVIGNGGSAAAAAHLVNDLVAGAYLPDGANFRAVSLTDNVSTLTALANDCGYEQIFERQLAVYLEPGDVVLAMSVSGNSENILRGVRYAREHGATAIALCGFDGGRLAVACDIAILAPTTPDEYGPVEDIFGIAGHILSGHLSMRRGKWLHH